MSFTPMKHVTGAIAVIAFVALFGAVATAAPLTILPNDDGFITEPGSLFRLPLIPAGFFGDKSGVDSDPVGPLDIPMMSGPILMPFPGVTTILVGPGCHTGMVNVHCYEMQVNATILVDTIVRRGGGLLDTSLTVPIELIHLSLASTTPLPVTYGGGSPSFFDIFVELDGPQPGGTLTLNRIGTSRSGTMDTVLPVNFLVTFEGTDPSDPNVNPFSGEDILQSRGNPFTIVPEPASVVMTAIGFAALAFFARRRKTL